MPPMAFMSSPMADAMNDVAANATAVYMADEEESEGNVFIGILWLCVIGFFFFAQHHVCDAYFVPAINVFIEKMRKSSSTWANRWGEEAVAGATICALGCNGPELASNLISMYMCNDAGIGVVVGSEIFNILIICGAASLASPLSPLPLERTPFARDCMFYFISIILLAKFLQDSAVQFYEALTLLCLAIVFVGSVYFTADIVAKVPFLRPDEKTEGGTTKKAVKIHGVEVDVTEITHSRMHDTGTEGSSYDLSAGNDGMMAAPVEDPTTLKPNARGSVGFDPLLGGAMLYYKDLVEVAVQQEGVMRLAFPSTTLIVTCKTADARNKLLEEIEAHDEKIWIHDYDATVCDAFEHLKHAWCSKKPRSIMEKLVSIPEFLVDVLLKSTLFMVDVKDISKEGRWIGCFMGAMFWLATFSFLMLQVAEQVTFNIPALSEAFLGVTVCAIGTSLPNAFASVIMAQKGKPGAAIANALGSNIQNVFLAMALPWVIWILFPGKDCEESAKAGKDIPGTRMQDLGMGVEGLFEGVIWMLLTLALVILFVLLPSFCTLNKGNGIILMILYVVYIAVDSLKLFHVLDEHLLFGFLPVEV